MPRKNRALLPGIACHITQRGVDRCNTFSSQEDRLTYLRLLHENLPDARARLLGFCLMTNHVHLIAVPEREDSLAVLLRRVHGRYAQYYNIRSGRTGHLWLRTGSSLALWTRNTFGPPWHTPSAIRSVPGWWPALKHIDGQVPRPI
jgi:REP element-mobilizing transposase RayT